MDAVAAPWENREPGEIPGRYRHCMRGGPASGESRSLGYAPRRLCRTYEAQVRRTAQMWETQGSASTEPVIFCCGKRGSNPSGLLFFVSVGVLPLHDCPGGHCRKPTEYCLLMPQGDPVRIRNNRPLLCLSQRAWGINWVYHALTGECNRVCPYLRTKRLCSFCV